MAARLVLAFRSHREGENESQNGNFSSNCSFTFSSQFYDEKWWLNYPEHEVQLLNCVVDYNSNRIYHLSSKVIENTSAFPDLHVV